MTDRVINSNIKHLKKMFLVVVAIIVIYSAGMKLTAIAADSTTHPASPDQKTVIVQKIRHYANKYNVSFDRMYNTIKCETGGTFDPQIQSNVKYNYSNSRLGIVAGTRERSFGLSQIHKPHHPTITREQATDIDFSIEFMARNYSQGRDLWYCD